MACININILLLHRGNAEQPIILSLVAKRIYIHV